MSVCDPMNSSPQDPLSIGFSKQKYCSDLPFLSLGELPDSGIEPTFPALTGSFLTTETLGIPEARFPKQTEAWPKTQTTPCQIAHISLEQLSNNAYKLAEVLPRPCHQPSEQTVAQSE